MDGGGNRLCVPISLPNNKVPTYAVLELVGFTSERLNKEGSSSEEQGRKRKSRSGTTTDSMSKKLVTTEESISQASFSVKNSTTFVQADASSFRELVQRLTGAEDDTQKMPVTKAPPQGRPGGTVSKRKAPSMISPLRNGLKSCYNSSLKGLKSCYNSSPKSPLTADVFGHPSPTTSSASSGCSQTVPVIERLPSVDMNSTTLELLPLFPVHSSQPLLMR